MKRFSQRESVLLGYSPQRSFENSIRKSDTNPEMDFSDVFGGPPRRFSIQESRARYSFSEAAMDPEPEEDATVLSADEKPVFGAETVNRRACPRDDFFDDIFKGDEIKSFNSPRRSSRDFFGSTPAGSRVMSPSRPMPPKSEPFSTSFPSQFSLPGKVPTKPKDSGQFGSTSNRGPHNKKDGGVPNGISNGHTSDTSLSRFSSQANELQGETMNDQPLYRQSPLSREVRNSHQESSGETKSDEKGIDIKSKRSETKEVPINSGQFHFSIYKWAGSGVQLLMPLGGSGKSRFKDRFRTERCSSSNGRIESDFMDRHLPTVEEHATSLVKDSVSLDVNDDGNNGTREDKKVKSSSNIEEGNDILSKHETNEKETHLNKFQTPKTEPKPLHELLNDENQEQDNGSKGKENAVKNKDADKNDANVKKKDAKRINSYPAEVTDASLQNSEPNSGDAFGKTRSNGKVREFVKIFNHESSEKIKNDLGSKSTRWKQMNIRRKENGFNNAVNTDGKVHILNKTKIPETSSREDDNLNKNKVKEDSQSKTSTHKKSGLSTKDKNASQFTEPLPNNCGNKVEPRAEPVHGYFQVEELSDAVVKVSQSSGESEQIRASNAKIQQWSSGRKGNIRSLLSTLQFVLWPESGWKLVPLVDLIEGSAVKRAYQRALLCLHPDKLQQKGAASHQKYIAERVFDILQEAWDHFNSLGGI